MKVTTTRLPNIREWANANNVPMDLVIRYQAARRRIQNNVSRFARKHNTIRADIVPNDIRLYPTRNRNFEQFLEARIMTLENRAQNTSTIIRRRMDTYLSNIVTVLSESDSHANNIESDRMLQWLGTATVEQKAEMIRTIGAAGMQMLAYIGDEDGEEQTLDYDLRDVVKGIHRVIMKKKPRAKTKSKRKA